MREYGQKRTAYWTDDKVQGLCMEAAFLFDYLLTGPHSNAIGCYRLPISYMADDLEPWFGTRRADIEAHLKTLQGEELIVYQVSTKTILIKNYLKHNPIANPNVAKHCVGLIEEVARNEANYPLVDHLIGMLETNHEGQIKQLRNRLETVKKRIHARGNNGSETPTLSDPTQIPSYPDPNGDPLPPDGGHAFDGSRLLPLLRSQKPEEGDLPPGDDEVLAWLEDQYPLVKLEAEDQGKKPATIAIRYFKAYLRGDRKWQGIAKRDRHRSKVEEIKNRPPPKPNEPITGDMLR